MNNKLIQIKLKQRLNKLDSQDYDNIECWQVCEAFNKAQIEWVRRQISGTNPRREGDDQTTRRIDDLQVILTTELLKGTNKDLYFETSSLPVDFLEFKRVSCLAKTECCADKKMTIYLANESDTDILLSNNLSTPDFQWGESFCTLIGNKIRIYHNKKFTISTPSLTYYRMPRPIEIEGCTNHLGNISNRDVVCEFKDDIIELLIDEAASIIAGDIENMTQQQRNLQNPERNN